MLLENLRLHNFKNYKSSSLTFSPNLNFIFGENGNGKTNLLESISMLCYTKSFLQNSENECLKYGEEGFEISGQFKNAADSLNKIKLTYKNDTNEKEIFYDNEKVTAKNEFIGKFPLVVLSPKDTKLTTGSPQERRRNFDLLISQISRVYLRDLRSLNRVLKQKNSLLKSNLVNKRYSKTELRDMIALWNDEIIEYGVKILIRRLDFIEGFRDYLLESFNKIVGSSYIPVINYESDLLEMGLSETPDFDLIRSSFRELLDRKMDFEISRGISMVGPQRDNYVFRMKKDGELFDVRIFASQGEHKTFVVALKLSEFEYINDNLENSNTGKPILLLDDVFSELDKKRIKKISGILTDYNQIFLTTTDYDYLNILRDNFKSNFGAYQIINGEPQFVN
ncbi:MAG: DNA replication and repair protein RecF [Chlorobi bacterium]|nr:DNA replication and repair protein RecF [Chlorobiota bacterium]MCI0717090.1 DNA replication and repair protein RecF [Chlorobiota bacterium]